MKGVGDYSYKERVNLSLSAGCDMVLICNNRDGVREAIEYMEEKKLDGSDIISSMLSHSSLSWEELKNSDKRSKIRRDLANIERN